MYTGSARDRKHLVPISEIVCERYDQGIVPMYADFQRLDHCSQVGLWNLTIRLIIVQDLDFERTVR